jgi:hypothetical protein
MAPSALFNSYRRSSPMSQQHDNTIIAMTEETASIALSAASTRNG